MRKILTTFILILVLDLASASFGLNNPNLPNIQRSQAVYNNLHSTGNSTCFNITYHTWAYNQTTPAIDWVQSQNYLTSVADNSIRIKYQNITNLPTCSGTEKLTFDGSILSCETDETGASSGTYNATYHATTQAWNNNYTEFSPFWYNHTLIIENLYSKWFYNMTTPFTNWLSTFAYNYNQTIPANAYTDTQISNIDYSTKNVNRSDYWDDIDSINATQMQNNNGVLNIFESWLTTLFNTLFGSKTTDDLTEGATNKYDNRSWNESRANFLYADKQWGYNQSQAVYDNPSPDWLSTFNSTYDTWAYNQTTPANAYTDTRVGTDNLHKHSILNITGVDSNQCSGTDKVSNVTFNNGDLQITCTADQTGSGGGGLEPILHPVLSGRRTGFYQPITHATNSFTAVGMTLPSITGTATSQPALAGTSRYYIQYASAATANSLAGQSGVFTLTRPAYRPKYSTIIRTDTAIDTRRIWVGITESALTTLAPTLTSTASAIDYVGVAYNSGVNDGKWMCCSGNGTNHQCTDMGLTVAPSTEYTIVVDWSVLGTLTCKVNSATTTRTTHLSTAAVGLGIHNGLTTLDATSRNHQISIGVLEQN